MRLRQLTCCLLAAAAVVVGSPAPAASPAASPVASPAASPAAAPGRWRFDEAVAAGGTGARQARRIAPASDTTNVLSPAPEEVTTTTPEPPVTKKLVTLAPGGNSIQDILFNNGYRDQPADAEPDANNIDNPQNLDGLSPRDVWLLDGNMLVLKGGSFNGGFRDTEPLDDFEAPYRQPKFPPPELLGLDELPPGLLAAWQYGLFDDGPPPLGPEGSLGYSPYGRPPSPEEVAGPHSNVGAPPTELYSTPGKTHSDAQPYVDGKPYTSEESFGGKPYTSEDPFGGKPYTSEDPYVDGETYKSDQPYVDGESYTDGEPYVDIQKFVHGPYSEVEPYSEPYTDKQPYEAERPYEGTTPSEDPDQPINPELMRGYSPLGRPEPRPDVLYETPRMETPPEAQIRVGPEHRRGSPAGSGPGSGSGSDPSEQTGQEYNGQSYGERRLTAGEVSSSDGERRGHSMGGGVRFPTDPPPQPAWQHQQQGPINSTRTRTYSVRTSYSSTSSQSSTSVRGHNARYLPPPRGSRELNPR